MSSRSKKPRQRWTLPRVYGEMATAGTRKPIWPKSCSRSAPARLRRPLVVAVGPCRGEQRAEVPVVERVGASGSVDEAEVAAVVVGERELVVAGALREEAAEELRAALVPAVARVGMPAALVLHSA